MYNFRHYILISTMFLFTLSLTFIMTNTNYSQENNQSEVRSNNTYNLMYLPGGSLLRNRVDVYYFHRTKRCNGCNTLERMMHTALEQFSYQISLGEIVVNVVNIEDSNNDYLVSKYDITMNGIMIDVVTNGISKRYKHLEDSWTLKSDALGFNDYIKREIETALSEVK